MKRLLLVCSALLCLAASTLVAAPTVSTPVITNLGANQATLTLRSDASGTGYFTLLTGSGAAAGTGAQTRDGLASTGGAAYRRGSLRLAANTEGTYTLRNLSANTAYTVCFTADDGATLQPVCTTASFTTTAAADLTGGVWVPVPTQRFTPGGAGELSIAFSPAGAPCLAFRDTSDARRAGGGQASMMSFDGTAWNFVGSPGFSRWIPNDCNVVFSPTGQPYVAYADYDIAATDCNWATVMTFNGASWVPVGTPRFTPAAAGDVTLAISPSGEPWIAFNEPRNGFKVAVMKFDGTNWVTMGSSLSDGETGDVKLAFSPDGIAYVAFRDDARSSRASVIRYVNSAWEYVGGAGFTPTTNGAYYLSLAFSPDGVPFLAYTNYTVAAKACVVRFDGTSWVSVGAPDFTPSSARYLSLAFAPDGNPWIGFCDNISGSFCASVMAFDGVAWSVRGSRAISSGGIAETPLAFGPDGTPYIAFSDLPDGKASIKRLQKPVTPTVNSVVVPTSGTYGTGDYLSFTVNFSTPVKVNPLATLRLTIGSNARFADYYSGYGTSSFVFRYRVASDDSGAVAVASQPILLLADGWIKNALDNTAADLTLNNVGSMAGVVTGTVVAPTLTAPTTTNLGANQVTLQFRSSATGRGYFTILPGAGATPGTGAQVKAGQNSTGAAAFRFGSLPLTANTVATYTVRNLTAGTVYTVCFTADDGTTVQSAPLTANVTTTAAVNYSTLNWTQAGAVLSVDAADYDVVAFAPDGSPYVAFQDYDLARKVTVKRFDGTNWTTVGTAGFSEGPADFVSLAFSPSGTPYVAYKDDAHSYKATVMQFTSGAWTPVGGAGISAGQACDESLAFAPDGTLHLAFRDIANGQKTTVMKFDGGAWSVVGSTGVTPGIAYDVSLAFSPAGQPHIAYRDESRGGKASVMKFDGTAWVNVGAAGFSADTARPSRLVFAPDGTPYVAFQDTGNGLRATVMKFIAGAWCNVGTAGFTPMAASNLTLAFAANGRPHVGYTDSVMGNKVTVLEYDGTDWVLVGLAGFSSGTCGFPSLAFAPDGRPWIAYKDNGNSGRATVMNLAGTTLTSTITTWPAPAAITYGTPLSSTQLNATAVAVGGGTPLAGTFTYRPAAGTVLDAGRNPLSVDFTPADPSYGSSGATTLITVNAAPATVSLTGLSATYNGSPRTVGLTTSPAGLSTSVTYNGSGTAPAAVGSYAVEATITNPNYTGSASGTLIIGVGAQTITFPAPGQRNIGDPSFTLGASASSGLAVSYTSSNTSVATVSGSTVTIVGAGSTNITARQAGNANYTAAPDVVQTLTITATAPRPQITASPVGQSVVEGETLVLAVMASGSGLNYQWRKDGVDIPGARSRTLTLSNVGAGSAGAYSVLVSNSGGLSLSTSAVVSILPRSVAPSITTQPQSQSAPLGSSLTLSAVASGTAPFTYQWYKDTIAIAGATLATYTINPVVPGSVGEYSVAVSNAAATTRSNGAFVTIGPRGLRAYFGTFGTGNPHGTFALHTREDGTGVFLAYEASARLAFVVRKVQIDTNRHFRFSMTPVNIARPAALATIETTVEGTVAADGSVTGTFTGSMVAALTATEQPVVGPQAELAGFYEAGVAGTSSASYLIVNSASKAYALTVNGSEADAAVGSVPPSGSFMMVGENRATIAGAIDCGAATLTTTVTGASGASMTCLGGNKGTRNAIERMVNVSGRGNVTSTEPLIAGFIVTGTAPKRVLVRGVGPSLAPLGVGSALTAARLEVFHGAKSVAVANDWSAGANASEIAATARAVGAFPLGANSRDAALLLTLEPGDYTAVVTGQGTASGVALAEVYDASTSPATTERVMNISSRAIVGSGDSVLFSGFVVSGAVPKRVLIRGAGVSLARFGVANALSRPELTLWSGQTVVARSTDWTTNANSAAIASAADEVSAFPLSTSGGDAALLVYLQPGAYCVQISGRDASSGVALAEVYELP